MRFAALGLLSALVVPVTAPAQEYEWFDAFIVVGNCDGVRASLAEPEDLKAGEGGEVTLRLPRGSCEAQALQRAFESRQRLAGVTLGTAPAQRGRESIRVPGKLEYPNITFYVPESDDPAMAEVVLAYRAFRPEPVGSISAQPPVEPQPAISSQAKLGLANRFSLTVDGYQTATFSELVAINTTTSPPTIVLRRAKDDDTGVRTWHEAAHTVQQGGGRRSASLVMYDYDGRPVARYTLENAWPSKVEIGGLRADASEVLMETVTIVAERIQRVSP